MHQFGWTNVARMKRSAIREFDVPRARQGGHAVPTRMLNVAMGNGGQGLPTLRHYSDVAGRAPLENREMRHFEELVSARASDIVSKWIDFFVLHKPVKSERITRRLK